MLEDRNFPEFQAGDTISVDYKIKEGNKERIQRFQGTVLQKKGSGNNMTFTIRKTTGGIGIERIFPISSPFIVDIKVHKKGAVRRARIFYLRDKKGKAARIKEKRAVTAEEKAGEQGDPKKQAAPSRQKQQEKKDQQKQQKQKASAKS